MKQVSRWSSTKFFSVGAVLGATLLLCLTAMLAAAPAAFSAPERASYIVVLKDDVAHPANVAHRHEENRGARISHIYGVALKGYSADLTPGAVKAIKKDPNVDYVESDGVIRPKGQVVGNQLKRVYAAQNPVLDIDGADDARVNVDIAILDTGVYPHPDLNIVSRVNCVGGGGGCKPGQASDDLSGHGTHVAGDAAAIDNGIGMVGTAPGAKIWSVKVVNDMGHIGTDEVGMSLAGLVTPGADLKDGNAKMSDAIAGINWVTINSSQIEVANMSFACATDEWGCARTALAEAIATSVNNGVVWVAAAGHEGLGVASNSYGVRHYPALLSDVITVSAMADYDGLPGSLSNSNGCPLEKGTQHDDRLMGEGKESVVLETSGLGSNYGPEVDMTAPGSCVFSTWSPYASSSNPYDIPGSNPLGTPTGSEYGFMYGSSVASALVAGAAADIAAQSNPNNRADVEKIRVALLGAGNYDWEDLVNDGLGNLNSPDNYQEPLLSLDKIPSVPSSPPPSPPAPPPAPPTATIGAVGGVSDSWATITGTVNPNGYDGRYTFECGVTGSGYTMTSAPGGEYFGPGTSPIKVAWGLTGLNEGTSYTCRLAAWNVGNVGSPSYSAPVTFTTLRVQPHIYFRAAADGKLHELSYKKVSSWHESGDLTIPIAAGTSPSSFRNTNGLKRTFFISSIDGKVHELSETGSGWAEGPALSQKVAPGTSPSAFASPGGGVRLFFIADADKKIHEVSYNGGWSESAALMIQKAGTTTSPVAVPYNGSTRIFFVGENGYIQFLFQNFPGASWSVSSPAVSRTKVVPGTQISAFVNTTGLTRAYFVSTGDTEADKNTIHELGYNPSTWSETAALTPAVATGSSPSALAAPGGGVWLYFAAASDNRIRGVSYNGSWSVGGPLSSPLATGGSPSALAWTGGQVKVYYPGADSKVHELSYNPASGWYDSAGLTQKMTTGAALAPIGGGSNGLSVHYVGADGRLRDLTYTIAPTVLWNEEGAAATTKMAAGTSPTSFVNTSNQPRAYFVSEDGKLRELAYNPANGTYAESGALSQKVAPGTSPSAFASPGGGVRLFFIADADKKIHEVSYNGSWSESAALMIQKAGTTTSPVAVPYHGSTRIFFVGENGYIQFLFQSSPGTSWGVSSPAVSRTKVVPGTQISAFVNTTGLQRAYFVSTGDTEADKNTIHELAYNPSEWTESAALTPAAAPGSSPSALPAPGGGVWLYFAAASDNRLRGVSYNGSWSMGGPLSSTLATGGSPSAVAWSNGGVKVYFPSISRRIRELSYNGAGAWSESYDLSGSVETGTSLSPFRMVG